MPIRVVCPGCQGAVNLADELAGKTVRCQQCQTVYRVGAPIKQADPERPAPAAPPARSNVTEKARPARRAPAAEDSPRPKRREDRERPTRPRKEEAAPSSRTWLVALVAGGGVLGLVVAVVGVLFAAGVFKLGSKAEPAPQPAGAEQLLAAAQAPKTAGGDKDRQPNEPKPDAGGTKEPVKQPPADPGPAKPPVREKPPVVVNPPDKSAPPVVTPVQPLGTDTPKPADPGPRPKDPARTEPPKPPAGDKPDAPRPPAGDKKVVKRLPGNVSDVAVGGGGRYLVLHLAKEKKLAIFDVGEARIARYINLGADKILYTAGQDKVVVVLPDTNVVQRWDLATGERDLAVPLAIKGTAKVLCMGSASQGPVYVGAVDGFRGPSYFLDLRTLKPLSLKTDARGIGFGACYVRASADGKTFGLWNPGSSPEGVQTVVIAGNEARKHYAHDTAGHVIPGPDGKVLYTARGLWTPEGKRMGDAKDASYCLPAVQGSFYLSIDLPTPFGPRANQPARVTVHLAGDTQPLVTLTDVDIPTGITQWDREAFGFDRRILFLPNLGRIAVIPTAGDRVELYRFDVVEALENSGVDYLVVTSQPVTGAKKGAEYGYQVVARSKKGGVKYRLDSAPKGMEVSDKGLVKWKVPADFADADADVILNVTDASGQEVFHNYKITVGGDAAPVARGTDTPPVKETARPDEPPAKEPKPAETGSKTSKEPAEEASASGIKPPALAQDRVVKALPSAADDVAVGGGGRYLVLRLPKEKKLAVFDVNEARIARYISLGADNAIFTAGQDKVVVILPDTNVIQRWSLATGQRDLSIPLGGKGKPAFVTMGSASQGPVLVETDNGLQPGLTFVDLKSLRPSRVRVTGGAGMLSKPTFIRASADGKTFGLWNPNSSPQGVQTLVVQGNDVKRSYAHDTAGHVIPGPDGKVLYTAQGRWTPDAKRAGGTRDNTYCLPAVQSGYYLSVRLGDRFGRRDNKSVLTVCLEGTDQPLVTLPEIALPAGINPWDREPFGFDRHIFLIPDAKLIVVIPETNDKLVLHRFDVVGELEKSGVDYLVVTSQPVTRAKKGAAYSYRVVAKSKKGGIKYSLDSAPKGMTITPEGQIKWAVPAGARRSEEVIVHVTDGSGQERFQTFTINVGTK